MSEHLAVLAKACDEASHIELIGVLAELATVTRKIPAVEQRALARLVAETEPARLGEASWKKVLTTALRISGADAARRLKRAETLGPRRGLTGEPIAPLWESTAAAQARGLLSEEHVTVIARFHRRLPSWVDVDTRAHADAQLAELGAGLSPEELRVAAEYLALMIDQDGPQPSEEERARKRCVRFGPQQPDGYSTISGWVSARCRAVLEAVFAKEAAPGRNMPADNVEPIREQQSGDGGAAVDDHDPLPNPQSSDTRTQSQRHHDAFEAVCYRLLKSGELGQHNGLPVTVIVSTTLQELEKGAGVAVTGGGSLIPIPDLIQLAAPAHHYLYIYDKHTGQSLYLARTKRLANAAQRIVLHARDRGCTRPGCTAPGYWCQAHHAVADWKNDGQTDVDDLTLACGPVNRMVENTGWRTRKNARNQTEWLPPEDLDNGRHRINGYHHPERFPLREDGDDP